MTRTKRIGPACYSCEIRGTRYEVARDAGSNRRLWDLFEMKTDGRRDWINDFPSKRDAIHAAERHALANAERFPSPKARHLAGK